MTRLIAIAILTTLSVLLFRYRANKKVQQGVVYTFLIGLLVYTISIVISELIR
jgi:hypothetical protein